MNRVLDGRGDFRKQGGEEVNSCFGAEHGRVHEQLFVARVEAVQLGQCRRFDRLRHGTASDGTVGQLAEHIWVTFATFDDERNGRCRQHLIAEHPANETAGVASSNGVTGTVAAVGVSHVGSIWLVTTSAQGCPSINVAS